MHQHSNRTAALTQITEVDLGFMILFLSSRVNVTEQTLFLLTLVMSSSNLFSSCVVTERMFLMAS